MRSERVYSHFDMPTERELQTVITVIIGKRDPEKLPER